MSEAQKLRGITTPELASIAKIGRPHLYDVLEGRAGASVDYIAKLATALDVDPSALLGDAPITTRTRRLEPKTSGR